MEELKGFLKDAWQVIQAVFGWLIQWWNWVVSDPINAAWWMGGVTLALAILVVVFVRVIRPALRKRRQAKRMAYVNDSGGSDGNG